MDYMIIALAVVLLLAMAFALRLARRSGALRRESLWLFLFAPWVGALEMIAELTADKKSEQAQTLGAETTGENEAVYHSIAVQAREAQDVVPLGDALRLDTPQQRRGLMMDVLRDDTAGYMNVLSMAQKSDDGEVVHYATTALAEQYRKEDAALRLAEERWKKNPQDREQVRAMAEAIGEYLVFGAAQGEAARARRKQYVSLMETLAQEKLNLNDGKNLIEALVELGENERAEYWLDALKRAYPDSQVVFLLGLQLAWKCGDRQMLSDWLARARAGEFRLGREGEEALRFWSGDKEEKIG